VGQVPGGSRLVVARENLRGFRGLTFDGFGSLLESGPPHLPVVFERLFRDQGKGLDPSAEEVWRRSLRTQYASDVFIAFRDVHRNAFQEMFGRFGLTGDLDACIEDAFDEYLRVRAYPEVASVLHQLETEVALAVVSNMDTMLLLEALHNNGLAFTFVITSEEEQRYKPAPSIFQRAIRYLGLPAANILHVGDSPEEDVMGASAAGMGALLMQRSGGARKPRGMKALVARDLREVRDFVRRSWE
jgi:2-haloalkanoic acid dehalogenase type II